LITGAAGVGKTTAISSYRGRSNNVWVVTGEPSLSTPRMLLDEVADLLGVTEHRSTYRVSKAIVARLRGTRGLLIVDEAQHLNTATLDQLRTLHDLAGVGVALVGNERVSSRIEGGSRTPEFAQLFSRVGMRMSRAKPSKKDVEAVLDAWEVAEPAVRQLLATIARKPGALRSMVKVLRHATMQAAAAGEALSGRFVEMAWQRLAAQPLGEAA
jgi:DNA transposition AAA+ family ATPase